MSFPSQTVKSREFCEFCEFGDPFPASPLSRTPHSRGTGFTIEPGVYFSDFGVRSEINMIVRNHEATVTGPLQTEILALV